MKPTEPNVRWGLLDAAISSIAPRAASRRYAARVAIANMRRGYDGAARSRATDGWVAGGTSADTEIAVAGPLLRARMRDLVRNNAIAAQAVQVLVNNIVGSGIIPRANTGDAALDKTVDQLWQRWASACDAHGHTTFQGLLSLAVREMIEGGDVFALKRPQRKGAAGEVPLRIELREADHLDEVRINQLRDGSGIRQGIEYDTSGRRVAYRVHRYDIEKRDGAPELWRAVDWEPLEISAVPIGADPGAQVRSDDQTEALNPCILTRQANAPAKTEITKGNDMPKSKKAGGDTTEARIDETEVQTRTADKSVENTVTPPDPDTIRSEERQRASEIMTLCRRHDLDALAADLIGRGVSLDTARAEILDKIADADPLQGRVHEPAPATARGNGDADTAYREAVAGALLHRHNPASHELTSDGRDFRGMSLIEMARHALERHGHSTRGMSRLELAGEALGTRAAGAMSTSDFPIILANVANKTLRQAYASSPRTFAAWARRATITDFKPVSRTQIAGAPDLEKVLESGEFKYGSIGEGKETYALATYGRIVAITRQVLINDDLDAFTRIPSAFGAAAADLESDIVYAILTQNPTMADNKALFHASHGNLGTAAGVTETALGEAYRKFGSQKGLEGRLISILPSYIITPPGSRAIEARKQMTQTTPSATADVNTFAGRLQVIEEPRLIPSTGNDPWFLAADPSRVDTIEYAYLDGQEGVYTETRSGFEVDGIEIKARHDFAAKAIDWRGLFKNAGV